MKTVLEQAAKFSVLVLFTCVALCGLAFILALFNVVNVLPFLLTAVLVSACIFGLCLLLYVKIS